MELFFLYIIFLILTEDKYDSRNFKKFDNNYYFLYGILLNICGVCHISYREHTQRNISGRRNSISAPDTLESFDIYSSKLFEQS